MKKVSCLLLVLFACSTGKAQHSVNLGLSIGDLVSYPLRPDPLVVGVSMEYDKRVFYRTHLRLSTGLEITDPKLDEDNMILMNWPYNEYLVVPVRAGLQHLVYRNKMFVFAESGVAIGSFPNAYFDGYETRALTGIKGGFSYAAGAGYRLALKSQKYLQGSLSFNRNHYRDFRFSWINLRLAYGWRSRSAA